MFSFDKFRVILSWIWFFFFFACLWPEKNLHGVSNYNFQVFSLKGYWAQRFGKDRKEHRAKSQSYAMISEHVFFLLLLLWELPVQLAPAGTSPPYSLSFVLFWDNWMIWNMSKNPESRERLMETYRSLFMATPLCHLCFLDDWRE